MKANVEQLHTYFLFPFSIDQDAVMEDHAKIWTQRQHWFGNLDTWVTQHVACEYEAVAKELGGWRRCSHQRFDLGSSAYQDMVFFHPFVRQIFFDTGNRNQENDALLRCYSITLPPNRRLLYEAEDVHGHSASAAVTDLPLSLFANGVSILTIGIQAADLSYAQALWMNEMMRKIYPSSDRQITSGRMPNRVALVLEQDSERRVLVEEKFEGCGLMGFRPRLSKILLALLYFAQYEQEEFEPILDERMIVNTFVSLSREGLPAGFERSDDYEIAMSRLLYVDRDGEGYRYNPDFIRGQMAKDVYRRWQHEGTLYGMTSYSNVTMTLAQPGQEPLVYRMFTTKNHLIAMVALFYRATLLDFAKESALVSRQLFPIFSGQIVRHHHIQMATRLMADYHYFNNYWFFNEITTKDEELEHFQLLCSAYRIDQIKREIGDEIGKLAGYIDRLYALRNNDAVNRLALLSMILGIGALVTGYYGMNIPHLATILNNGTISGGSLVATSIMALLSLGLIAYIVVTNWVDYRSSLVPHHFRRPLPDKSLRRQASITRR
jgi:CorA-like Mg2+ transporter protein